MYLERCAICTEGGTFTVADNRGKESGRHSLPLCNVESINQRFSHLDRYTGAHVRNESWPTFRPNLLASRTTVIFGTCRAVGWAPAITTAITAKLASQRKHSVIVTIL